MKRNLAAVIFTRLILLIVSAQASYLHTQGQENYWQQEVHYKIDVTLNDQNNTLQGAETIDYINNSPDTLHYIWFHLWANAYKDKTTAFYRQLARLGRLPGKAKTSKENGFIEELAFTVDGKTARVEEDLLYIDIIKIILNDNLLPGRHVTIATPFLVKIPDYTSRFGYSNGMYMITQWYPKPAVYDQKGWHPMPYLDQGEFYSEFGSFSVNINVPSRYVVAATGSLLTTEELINYKTIGGFNYQLYKQQPNSNAKPKKYVPIGAAYLKTLQFYGKDIHDFAWFADKNFIIQYDTTLLNSGKSTELFSFKQPNGNQEWKNSISYIKDAVRSYSNWVGEYAYPVANVVEGPANSFSGGMEYPMITIITSPGADRESLDAVIAHEVGHNWFYGILGTNERDHAWMDEGINTYYQFRYEAEKYRTNSIFGMSVPSQSRQKSSEEFLASLYAAFARMPTSSPINMPSCVFFFRQGLLIHSLY